MEFVYGKDPTRPHLDAMTWNPDGQSTTNPHMLITGSSGSGKTTFLLKIVRALEAANKHIFIFDLKGDMVISDINGEKIGNYIEFTAWDSDYGINPFEFDTGVTEAELLDIINNTKSPTKEQYFKLRNSGPRVQVNRIIEIIKKNFLPNMGTGQKDILMYLLADTYLYKSFKYNDYTTWRGELPNLEDTLFLIKKIKSYYEGGMIVVDEKSEKLIVELNKVIVSMKNKDDENNSKEKIKENIEVIINKYIDESSGEERSIEVLENKEWFSHFNIETEKYNSKDAYRTVVKMESYINSLVDSGVFHSTRPPVSAGLNIINISGLDVEIQKFIVDIWLGKVFKSCKIRGTYADLPNRTRGEKCDTFVIIDESKLIAGNSREKNDPFSYLNRMATEARGFGLGLVVASQSAEHYPPEFLKNFYSQIVLNTGIADFKSVRNSFGISKELLETTQVGWGNALVKTGTQFTRVKLQGSEV